MGDVELLLDAKADLGEGPVWLGDGRLQWVDITRGLIHVTDVASGQDGVVASLPEMVGAAVPSGSGGIVAATQRGFLSVDDGGDWSVLAEVEADVPRNRMNDGKCDPAGRFWAGTMELEASSPSGALYRLDPDGTVTREFGGVSVSNGLGWSPDRTLMYYIDSLTWGVDVFDFDVSTGAVSNRRRLVDVEGDGDGGVPDGMAVDAEGGLWVAIYGDGRVQRYLPDGTPDISLPFPASRVTSCAFGGEGLRTLYVTSAMHGLGEDELREQPLAGGLFAVETEVAGLPVAGFGDPLP